MRNEQVGPHRDRMGGFWGSWGGFFLGEGRTESISRRIFLPRELDWRCRFIPQ